MSRSRSQSRKSREWDRNSKPRDRRDRDKNLQDSPSTKIPTFRDKNFAQFRAGTQDKWDRDKKNAWLSRPVPWPSLGVFIQKKLVTVNFKLTLEDLKGPAEQNQE